MEFFIQNSPQYFEAAQSKVVRLISIRLVFPALQLYCDCTLVLSLTFTKYVLDLHQDVSKALNCRQFWYSWVESGLEAEWAKFN